MFVAYISGIVIGLALGLIIEYSFEILKKIFG